MRFSLEVIMKIKFIKLPQHNEWQGKIENKNITSFINHLIWFIGIINIHMYKVFSIS